MNALKQYDTWELVPPFTRVQPISYKWVYKVKTHLGESIERYKARLMARGFSQKYGLDYNDTFSSIPKITTVHFLLALATSKSWKL